MNDIIHQLKSRIVDYVMARQCGSGGFCFYRLDEPNGADTYHALTVLHLLDVGFQDAKTAAFLKRLQNADGSYDGIYAAFYAIGGLRLLGHKPDADPGPFIDQSAAGYRLNADRFPAGVASLFQRAACLVNLLLYRESEVEEGQRERLNRLILAYRNGDGGFGHPRSTLTDTAFALRMLGGLAYPVESLAAETFSRRCEDAAFGFTDIPGSSLSCLESLDAGLTASQIAGYRPRYLEACVDFIMACQNRNGGFARAINGGISTLENTCCAVHVLKTLEGLVLDT